MPDRSTSIATYAAGASLAAITLVYVFGPTFFIDGDNGAVRKKTVVGLTNGANDCFVNSVLQSLAGLGDLRKFLIRETHRRELDGPEVYLRPVRDPAREGLSALKLEGLQAGLATRGLKDVLDALNERPLYRKTISAQEFIRCLEQAFKQRISRQQQDAQEFFQVVAERVMDEYHAGHRARKYERQHQGLENVSGTSKEIQISQKDQVSGAQPAAASATTHPVAEKQVNGDPPARHIGVLEGHHSEDYDEEDGFPMEGGTESQIECLTCGFKPKPTVTTFCSMTLSVPQINSTSLSSMFDQMFKTEYIEDFKCEKCRLVHALEVLQGEYEQSNSEKFKEKHMENIQKLTYAIEKDPESGVEVELPDTKYAPKRKIAKHVRITGFPRILAVHLSRSIYDDAGRSSTKNLAKVNFPEHLSLGGLVDQRRYRLSSMVAHKGSHHSGHYEAFRRQNIAAPFSTPNAFQAASVYSKASTPLPSQISTPLIASQGTSGEQNAETSTLSSTPEPLSPISAASTTSLPYTNGNGVGQHLEPTRNGGSPYSNSSSTSFSKASARVPGPTSAPREPDTSSLRSARSAVGSLSSRLRGKGTQSKAVPDLLDSVQSKTDTTRNSTSEVGRKRKSKSKGKWWRISDEKVNETTTSKVLGMQKEVYMLFYELEQKDDE